MTTEPTFPHCPTAQKAAKASQDFQLALDLDAPAPAVTVRTVDYSDALPHFDAIRRADSFTL